MDKDADARLLDRLSRSQVFKDYQRAFGESTQLPLSISPIGFKGIPHSGDRFGNPFCHQLAESSESCAACVKVQEQLCRQPDKGGTRTAVCFAGLSDSVVPVRAGDRVIGFLQSGQIALKEPDREGFERVVALLEKRGAQVDLDTLKRAYFGSRVVAPDQYKAMIGLLEIFAQHLKMISNQIVVQEENAEQPFAQRARAFIETHFAEPITLDDIAKELNISTFYFCKRFRKATGMSFTEYLSRTRIERAKELLLNPHQRVSEIAFEVGFQTLTHFNRVFHRLAGCSPSAYRSQLPA